MSETILDARGLICPLPVLRAKKMLNGVPAGGMLIVLATDPGSVSDFQAFCRQPGYELVEWAEDLDGVFRYCIRKTG